MNNLDLEKLKSALPKNYIDTICERTRFSRAYVCQVINGERNNFEIIDAAILLAKEEKVIREERQQQINNL